MAFGCPSLNCPALIYYPFPGQLVLIARYLLEVALTKVSPSVNSLVVLLFFEHIPPSIPFKIKHKVQTTEMPLSPESD
jgi:hypothetical protein